MQRLITPGFNYDQLGNRIGVINRDGTNEAYAVNDKTNRYNETSGTFDINCTYDHNGNLLTDGKGYHYQWDAENRLIRIYKYSGQTPIDVVKYKYDALGRRIEKEDCIASQVTRYYYDGWRMLASYDGSDVARQEFVYGNYLDEVLMMTDGGNDYYVAHNHLYSPVAILDDAGAVVERYEYNAYGQQKIYDANFNVRTNSSFDNCIAFTGQRLDVLDNSSLTLMYYKHRYYDTYTGRFLSSDPLGYVDGLNFYQYVGSNSVNRIDPMGTDFIAVADRGVSGTGTVAWHYSLQLWETKCRFFGGAKQYTEGYSKEEINKKLCCPAKKIADVELLADPGWTVWASRKENKAYGGRKWAKKGVSIAYIRYDQDRGNNIMPIADGSPQWIKQKWNRIIAFAKTYKYAEQDGFQIGPTFTRWPRSNYKALQTNSNTFVRAAVAAAGLTMAEMDGSHPGKSTPSYNIDEAWSEGYWWFKSWSLPWKGGTPNPKPTRSPETRDSYFR
ncbi:MAG: RHS repeat-associated core domain-containing protein [Phycisphaerae bacterium]|nr:RHS repeat-associated core domain-containing protein [Phycisphaerae bacterium]